MLASSSPELVPLGFHKRQGHRTTTEPDTLAGLAVRRFAECQWLIGFPVTGSVQSNSGRHAGSVSQRSRKGKKSMPLIQILLALIVVGVLLLLVNRFIPMQRSIKSILNGVVIIAVVLWLLNVFGLFHSLARIHVGT